MSQNPKTAAEALELAAYYEAKAAEMRFIGDTASAWAFKTYADTYLDEAIELETKELVS